MPSDKKLVMVAGFTLALLIASTHGATALCGSRTGIMCTSDEMCVAICLQRRGGNTGGYCSTEHVAGDPSCVCTKPCAAAAAAAAQSTATTTGEKPAATETAGWQRGRMEMVT